MKIAFLAERRLTHTQRFTDFFSERGHEVHLITFEAGLDLKAEIHTLKPGPGPTLLAYFWRRSEVIKLLRNIRPDVINAHQVSSYGNLMASIDMHPWVVTTLGSDILLTPHKGPFSYCRTIWALLRSDLITSMSPYMTAKLVTMGFHRKKIVQSCFGIKPEVFNSEGRQEHRAGEVWNLICTRYLEPVYDHATILKSCRILSEQDFPFHLTLVGSGSLHEQIKAQTTVLGLDAKVTMLGNLSQSELAEQLKSSHIFITASHSDGANISLLEAMACGCFPVASDIPASRQWGVSGRDMLMFPIGDAVKLAQSIMTAAEDQALYRSAQVNNYRTVAERATQVKNLRIIEEAFLRLARSAQ